MFRLRQYSHVYELPYEKIEMHEARTRVDFVKYKLKMTDAFRCVKRNSSVQGFYLWLDVAGNCICFTWLRPMILYLETLSASRTLNKIY